MYRFIERKYRFSPYRDDNFCLKLSFRTGQVSRGASVKNENLPFLIVNRLYPREGCLFNLKSIARQDTLAATLKIFPATDASTNFVKFSSLTIRRKGRKDGVERRGSFYFNEGRINT